MLTEISQPNSDWKAAELYWQTSLDTDLFQILLKVCDQSDFVKRSFCRYPAICASFLQWHIKVINSAFEQDLAEQCKQFFLERNEDIELEAMAGLRIFRRCHSAAVAVLELSNRLTIESSMLRISVLAELLVDKAREMAEKLLQPRLGLAFDSNGDKQNLVVLAMGKLGGYELNFSSDIDLIFFYSNNGSTKGGSREVDSARYFQRLSALCIKLLDEVTEEGFVFRVDMRLRPYGDAGALIMTFSQAEDYYQEQGREWERFAMVRGRIITGNEIEKETLNAVIRPFCFRRYIDYGVIDSIRNMKSMISREVRRKGLNDNIKLGAGGIREVEFIVQALQLIQGGRDPLLQEKSILKVLPAIVKAKLLPEKTAHFLSEAYRFLRRLEHCIQELEEKQTQQLPENQPQQKVIAEVMGFENWQELYTELCELQQKVHQHFQELLGEERNKDLVQDDFYKSLAEGHVEAEKLCEYCVDKQEKTLTLDEANRFLQTLDTFISSSSVANLSARGASRLKGFFPALLATCLRTEQPYISLERTLKIIQAILKRTAYLDLLSENPPILSHLVELASKSEWIVTHLSEYPILFDELLYPNSLYEPLQAVDLESELRQSLLRTDKQDEEEILDVLRAFKQINELRVAAALLAQRVSISQVSRYLTQLAQVVLNEAINLSWQLVTGKHGRPESLRDDEMGFIVIGYGKLGGVELGFGSDLDLVFLFNQNVNENTMGDKPLNNTRFYTRLSQKLIHLLSTRTNLGLLYEVDMRLRPSGASGLLVSHIDAYRDYQMESAWTWEHQALVRARWVAGDLSLGETFNQIRHEVLNKKREDKKLVVDVVEMRQKMRTQLEKKHDGKIDLKQGEGGLVDIEFITQYLMLSIQSEKNFPNNTVDCLSFAKELGFLSAADAKQLITNYRKFRNRLNEKTLLSESSLLNADAFLSERESVVAIWHKLFES